MKGIVFTELVDFVERHAGSATLEDILERSDLSTGGGYTTVGNYPHEEAVRIVLTASNELGAPAGELMRQFGRELFPRFVELYPRFFEGITDAPTFLRGIQTHIHDEVLKLYPESNPPRFIVSTEEHALFITYNSHRPMADVAMGLIEGCVAHFGQPLVVRREDDASQCATQARFSIAPH
jgi:hypothetical protein